MFAADEEGGLRDGGAVPGGEVLPVPVDVAVAVEAAGEARTLELLGQLVEFRLGEPGRAGIADEPVGHFPAGRHEEAAGAASGAMVSADRLA